MSKPLRLFIPITKIDAAQRLVYGTIAAEELDRSGESFDYESSKPYFEKWSGEMSKASDGKNLGNVRVMHTAKAAGMLKDIDFNDGDKIIQGVAKIVDDDEWKKVEEGVYTGFSMGGSYARKWTDPNGVKKYTARPSEVSLVDAPCIKSATFEYIKADGATELRKFVPHEPTSPEIAKEATELAKAANNGKLWTDFIAEGRASLVEKMLGAEQPLDLTGHAECEEGPPPPLEKAMERTTTTEKTSTTERMSDEQKKEEDEDSGDQSGKTDEQNAADKSGKKDEKADGDKKDKDTKVDGLAGEEEEPADASKIDAARGLVKQVWAATDGKTFDKKDECVKYQAGVDAAANPLTKAIAEVGAIQKGDSPGEPPLKKFWDEQPEGLRDLSKIAAMLPVLDKLASAQPSNVLRKGVYDIGEFARALQTFVGIQSCLQYEADYEKDGSKIPAELRVKIAELADIFLRMSKEEISEMLATMPGGILSQTDPALDPEVGIVMAQAEKSLNETTLQKIGARNSTADKKRLQGIHDYLVELGVACATEEVEKLRKDAVEVGTLQKVISDALPAIEELKKGAIEQAAEIKRLKDQPMPGGPARLNVVEKGVNAGAVGEQADPARVEAILSSMTPDQIQTMMIKISQSKPMGMLERGKL